MEEERYHVGSGNNGFPNGSEKITNPGSSSSSSSSSSTMAGYLAFHPDTGDLKGVGESNNVGVEATDAFADTKSPATKRLQRIRVACLEVRLFNVVLTPLLF